MCLTPLKRQRLDICFKLFEILVPVDNGDAETNVHLASVLLACVVVMASSSCRRCHNVVVIASVFLLACVVVMASLALKTILLEFRRKSVNQDLKNLKSLATFPPNQFQFYIKKYMSYIKWGVAYFFVFSID